MIHLWEKDIPGFDPDISAHIPTITPYILEQKEEHGAVIVCPGGGYQRRADHEGEPIALWLNSIGLSAFVLNYRVFPYQHPYPMVDVQRSICYVRYNAAKWRIDPNRIGILGFSAGGHLASTAGTLFHSRDIVGSDPIDQCSARPDAMILCYPVITFGEYRHQGSMNSLLGENPEEGLKKAMSNEQNITANTPPTFLWHTAEDQSVPVENSLLFAGQLSRHKVPFSLHVFPKGRHGLGLGKEQPDVAVWTDLCESWLKEIGFIR